MKFALSLFVITTIVTKGLGQSNTGLVSCSSHDLCSSSMACINGHCADPCESLCGVNTYCITLQHHPACACKEGYTGNPFIECKEQGPNIQEPGRCSSHDLCSSSMACINGHCADPCESLCGENTYCTTLQHLPACACKEGYSGNPFIECKEQAKACGSLDGCKIPGPTMQSVCPAEMEALRCELLTDQLSLRMQSLCQGAMPAGEVRLNGTVITEAYSQCAEKVLNLEVREDDIWVVSFPTFGTIWTEEMVWLLRNNFDCEKAKSTFLFKRFLFLESKPLWGKNGDVIPDVIEEIKSSKSPRFIKTHLPAHLLPKQIWTKKPKIIYVSRDAKETAISYYHHFRLWNNYSGSQELFLRAFVEDKVIFSPFWDHVLSYWKRRHEPNVLFNTFEDMKTDLRSVLKRTADFLEVSYTNDQERKMLNHLNFASIKDNISVNFGEQLRIEAIEQKEGRTGFMRQGEVGGRMKELTIEQNKELEAWTARYLKGTDYPLPY